MGSEPRPRRDALRDFSYIEATIQHRSLAVFLDYDGTLCPIVEDPAQAWLSESMREAIAELTHRAAVSIVSGRDRDDVERRVALPALCYVGNHGLDIRCRERTFVHPMAREAVPVLDELERRLQARLGGIHGVVFERKRFSFAVHYRGVAQDSLPDVSGAVHAELRRFPQLRAQTGESVYDLVPAIPWHKGSAVEWILDALGSTNDVGALYLGDDDTDTDAFRALAGRGISIGVGERAAMQEADFHLAHIDDVERFLRRLARAPLT